MDARSARIEAIEQAGNARLRTGLAVIAVAAAGGLGLAVAVNVVQYRRMIRRLKNLRESVARLSRGQLLDPLTIQGPAEFRALADDLNRMARELASLYADLERKVAIKSRELARSERLASVGFLAAGVAHEINNPLNTITGHAELALRKAADLADARRSADVQEALQIIIEEGFRCKSITEKLLSLAASQDASREVVDIGQVAGEVTGQLLGHRQCRDRHLYLELPPEGDLTIQGNASELKQVLLNLALNALQAVPLGEGVVKIDVKRLASTIEICVSDNGRGMSAKVLERVFEPFYSDHPRGDERTLGLGLSITHAIVEAHGGQITAESPGPGRGSRFIIRLPAYVPNDERGPVLRAAVTA
ncbi:MAG: HAMP domain-containing protein [Phycisphaerae bacterium]